MQTPRPQNVILAWAEARDPAVLQSRRQSGPRCAPVHPSHFSPTSARFKSEIMVRSSVSDSRRPGVRMNLRLK
jgi:hypothetical protein